MIEVNCPTCNKVVTWTKDEPFKPFCSQRCKLIDLGEWATESYKIASNSTEKSDDEQFYGQNH